jgi:hypothetical protein
MRVFLRPLDSGWSSVRMDEEGCRMRWTVVYGGRLSTSTSIVHTVNSRQWDGSSLSASLCLSLSAAVSGMSLSK